jgi:membrane protease YdiL (CAAX protease family)
MRKGRACWSESRTLHHHPHERWSPSWRGENESRNRRRTNDAFRHHQRAVAAVSVVGTGLLGASLSTQPDSTEFYALTFAVAGTWLTGGLALERPLLGWDRSDEHAFGRLVVTPILIGAATFGVFVGAALVARRIPLLNGAISSILRYPDRGSESWVLATTLANGAAEELFFRGALFTALSGHCPVLASTAAYVLATTATRNPALVLASGVMGGLFAAQRRSSGGILAPILTHLTWSTLMLHCLPPLFRDSTTGAPPRIPLRRDQRLRDRSHV